MDVESLVNSQGEILNDIGSLAVKGGAEGMGSLRGAVPLFSVWN